MGRIGYPVHHGVGYIANKLTNGYTVGYVRCKVSDKSKRNLLAVHGFASLILALALPNNYLGEIEFFRNLFAENELWIAAAILFLLFTFLAIFGTVFTLIARRQGLEPPDYKFEWLNRRSL